MEIHTLSQRIGLKENMTAQLEFELTSYDVTVQRVGH